MLSGRRATPRPIIPSNPATSVSTQLIGYSATVSGSGPTPTGTVTFSVGDTDAVQRRFDLGYGHVLLGRRALLGEDTVTVSLRRRLKLLLELDHLVDRRFQQAWTVDVGDPLGQPGLRWNTNVSYSATVSVVSPGSGTRGGWHGRLHLERHHDRHLLGSRPESSGVGT